MVKLSQLDIDAFKRISIEERYCELHMLTWDTSHLREKFPSDIIEFRNIS